MIHTLVYFGDMENNHHLLISDTCTRIDRSGHVVAISPPAAKVNGLVFGYMQESNDYYAVVVENVVLLRPLKLDKGRHSDGKGYGPKASQFGDDSARRLLDDIISQNPFQRQMLAGFYGRIS